MGEGRKGNGRGREIVVSGDMKRWVCCSGVVSAVDRLL